MLNRNLDTTIDNLYRIFDRTIPKLHKYNDETFLDAIKKFYGIADVDMSHLKNCLIRLNAMEQQFEKGTVQIELLSENDFKAFYAKCEGDFKYINTSMNEIMERILKAEAETVYSGSDEGSVKVLSSDEEEEKEKASPKDSDVLYHQNLPKRKDDEDPSGGSAHKGKKEPSSSNSELKPPTAPPTSESSISESKGDKKTFQNPVSQPVTNRSYEAFHGRPHSGMERMIIAISDIAGIPAEEVEKLNAHQIKNVFKIMQIQRSVTDPVSDVIIAALEKRQVAIRQIKGITDEMKNKIDIILNDKCTSHTLNIGDVLAAIETIKKCNSDSNVGNTRILSPEVDKDQPTPSPKLH